MRQLGTPKEEGVGLGAIAQDNLCKDAPFDDQIETLPLQLFLNAKDLIEDAGLFRVGLLKSEGQDLHLGPVDFGIFRKPAGGAFHLDTDLFMKGLLIGMVQPVADPSSNIFDDADKLNTSAFLLEPGASFISGVCRKEGSVGGDDFIGEKPEALGDLHQDVKDLIVKILPQTLFKIGESGLAGDVLAGDPGVKTKVLSRSQSCNATTKAFMSGYFSRYRKRSSRKRLTGS